MYLNEISQELKSTA